MESVREQAHAEHDAGALDAEHLVGAQHQTDKPVACVVVRHPVLQRCVGSHGRIPRPVVAVVGGVGVIVGGVGVIVGDGGVVVGDVGVVVGGVGVVVVVVVGGVGVVVVVVVVDPVPAKLLLASGGASK